MKIGQGYGIKILLIVFIAICLAMVYFSVRYFLQKSLVPEDFINARQQSSLIASEINSLINGSLENLNQIAEKDRDYQFSSALALVKKEQKNIDIVKNSAVELIKQLGKIAEIAPNINPKKARDVILSAVSEEISLASRLVIYNSYFSGLLETLKLKFSGDIKYDASDVQILIQNMNNEVIGINNLNQSFNKKMEEFDEIIRKNNSFFPI